MYWVKDKFGNYALLDLGKPYSWGIGTSPTSIQVRVKFVSLEAFTDIRLSTAIGENFIWLNGMN